MNTPNVEFQIFDLTFTAGDIARGRSGVLVTTKRGPFGKTDLLITSWPQFERIFGGLMDGNPGPLLCKRALERGSALRVYRMGHFTGGNYDATAGAGLNNILYTLAGNLGAGHTVTYAVTGNGSVSQVFATSSQNTLALLAKKIKDTYNIVLEAKALNDSQLIVTPRDAAITTATLSTSGSGAPAVSNSAYNTIRDTNTNPMFELVPKYKGLDNNNLSYIILPASNGKTSEGYFDLLVEHLTEPQLNEKYTNLKATNTNIANSTYLAKVVSDSQLATVTYKDLSGVSTTPIVPLTYQKVKIGGASNGSALVAADYIGDSSVKTGLTAFDGVDDVMQIAILDDVTNVAGVAQAAADYAAARKDLQAFIHLAGATESALVTSRDALSINTPYAMLFGGGLKVVDPLDSAEKSISELGDVLGIAAYSEKEVGPWYSFSGPNRGIVLGALGADNQFGAPGNKVNLDLLANRQINTVINRNSKIVLWGGFTSQLATSQQSFANVVRLNIYLKKSLGPLLENFLEEPNDLITWKKIYLSVKPFLDGLVSKRAMYDYRWEGDQFADSMANLVVNDPAQVTLGKYKVNLICKDIVSLQEFGVNIYLADSGISFEDVSIITQ